MNYLAVLLGGAIGSGLRYIISLIFLKFSICPIGTLFANLLGCFLIGLIYGYLSNKTDIAPCIKLFLTTGLLGGLTTFSTFCFEVFDYIHQGRLINSLVYLLVSVLLGILFAALGYFILSKTF